MEIFLLGDQTADQYAQLRKACHQKHNVLVETFLEHASLALREETRNLPQRRRQLVPDFLTVLTLVESYHAASIKVPELESSLVTLSHLVHFIGYFEENPSQFPNFSNTRTVGLCTGLIAAAAIASARCLSELIPLAVEAVRISFRVGSRVGVARDLLDGSDVQSSWSTIVTGITEQAANIALDEFHSSSMIDTSRQAYVSAVSTAAVTISGPPTTTQRLFAESIAFQNSSRVAIPIFAPYHARHLFSGSDIDNIIDDQSKAFLLQFEPRALVHSSATGKCHRSNNTYELMLAVLREILLEPVRWDLLLGEVMNASSMNVGACQVTALGVTNIINSLVFALRNGGQNSIELRDHNSWPTKHSENTSRTQHDKIAIVGMSGRFPNAANHEALWDLLMNGLDVHREVPKDRFDAQAHCDPSGKGRNKSHTPYGCFIDEPGLFDPRFFNMSPREAAQTDPMGRLALVTAYEALEMSGYVPNRTPSTKLHRIGTFYGQTSDDWREINAAENVDTYFITGGVRAFASGRINYFFKFSGPSFSIDTACSSSLAAIQLACTSLWAGDCDTACAGGLNVLTNPDIFAGLSKGQFLSKTGSCKTYDNDADGYCRGDGCGSIILKRYQDAIMDNDNILGCILSAGTNHSADAVSITHPHSGAQEFLYKKVLSDAGVDAHDVTYVEMHGTGTQAGDGIEMTSVTNVFAPPSRRRQENQPLYLGAVKANIGHGEAASGINSMIKLLMMMREDKIPANVGIKGVMNKSFPKDLAERNVHIPVQAVSMPRHGSRKRKLFLNNFSAAGGNTAVLLEDGPLREKPAAKDPRSTHVITVSARAISSLNRNIKNLAEYLDAHPETELPSLSYTTTARRLQHNYRIAFTANNMSQVKDGLLSNTRDTYSPIALAPSIPAFVFTGQGSQYTGLAQKLYEDLKSFRDDIDNLDHLCRVQKLPSFLPLVTGADVATLSPVVIQLGMACVQVALARMWASWGVRPCAVVGHSLGEYAALHVAGVISASDMIYLVGQRAEILVQTCTQSTHGMLAVKGSESMIVRMLGDNMTEVACRNTPEETVLCGTISAMEAVHNTLDGLGVKSTMLKVPFAFHSSQVQPILESFKIAASNVVFNKPNVPILSPLLGSVIREAGIVGPEYLARHARETMDFCEAIAAGENENVFSEKTPWLEIGAHPVCSGMVKACLSGSATTAASLRRNEDPWKSLANSVCALYTAGVYLNFDEFHREFNDAHQLLTLPTYSFDNKNYWLDYHHNWTLTKGLKPAAEKAEPSPVEEKKSKLSTTSCQRIVFEELHANVGTVIVQSDLAEPKLNVAVSGHLVNDAPLCPSSLYADMALTVADYLYKQLRPGASQIGLNVCKMEVPKPLIAKLPPPPEGQHIQVEATADLEAGHANLKFRSVTPDGKLIQEHANCIVKFESTEDWYENWNMTKYMVETQIDMLKQKLTTGAAHKVLRGVAYKLFKALVNYNEKYRGMEEVILDGKDTEATAKISFQADENDGNFFCSPYWIDSLCHITGFICNGTDLIDSDLNVFISHGWGSMRFARPFSKDKTYRSYVRMLPQASNVRAGDVYIFEDQDLVGVVGGVKFQQIPRRVMDIMLPPLKARPAPAAKAPPIVPVQTTTAHSKPKVQPLVPIKTDMKLSKPKTVVFQPAKKSMTAKVMDIISSETDVNMSELVDDAAFENLGVDSLMSLTISAKFREELELEIPSSLFTERPTVGAMKAYFAQFDGSPPPTTESDTEPEDTSDSSSSVQASTAPSSPPSLSDYDEKAELQSPKALPVTDSGASPARLIIAQEMGVSPTDLSDKSDLAELGMDSLMSLAVLSALREETGQDFPSTFLVTNPTLEDIEHALGMRQAPKPAAPKKPKLERSISKELATVCARLQAPQPRDVSHCPPAQSVCLQGNPKTATKTLFLFPDGSGSATSYTQIPRLGADVAVYGLNCPFMKTPDGWTVDLGVPGVAQLFVAEMQRRQPHGPYYIGGWSAGGVIAYEGARQLLAAGQRVARLVLIDAPCPFMSRTPLPPGLHLFLDRIGVLGGKGAGSAPSWLLPHFAAAIRNLAAYEPLPVPAGRAPKTFAIWCRSGICRPGDPRPPCEGEEPAPMKWLLDDRTDFGDNGWGGLVGKEAIECGVMEGNHFTMMRDELAPTLGELIKRGMGIET